MQDSKIPRRTLVPTWALVALWVAAAYTIGNAVFAVTVEAPAWVVAVAVTSAMVTGMVVAGVTMVKILDARDRRREAERAGAR